MGGVHGEKVETDSQKYVNVSWFVDRMNGLHEARIETVISETLALMPTDC